MMHNDCSFGMMIWKQELMWKSIESDLIRFLILGLIRFQSIFKKKHDLSESQMTL